MMNDEIESIEVGDECEFVVNVVCIVGAIVRADCNLGAKLHFGCGVRNRSKSVVSGDPSKIGFFGFLVESMIFGDFL